MSYRICRTMRTGIICTPMSHLSLHKPHSVTDRRTDEQRDLLLSFNTNQKHFKQG